MSFYCLVTVDVSYYLVMVMKCAHLPARNRNVVMRGSAASYLLLLAWEIPARRHRQGEIAVIKKRKNGDLSSPCRRVARHSAARLRRRIDNLAAIK